MKRYLIIILITLFFTPFAAAQVVKRTTKTPNFFVPGSVMKSKTDAEKLSSAATANPKGGVGKISPNVTPSPSPSVLRLHFKKAPIDEILGKQSSLSKNDKINYIKAVVNSFTLYPSDLDQLLQSELNTVNQETVRMKNIMQTLRNSSWAYQLANFELKRQISQDMVKNRKHYKKIKQRFTEIIKETPPNSPLYIVEAKNPLFWKNFEVLKLMIAKKKFGAISWKGSNHFKEVSYITIFNSDYKHLFSYYRQHLNMLKQKRIIAPGEVGKYRIGQREINIYQQLFDGYLTDLNRIGKGLDINNPQLLRQLNEMQNRQISI